MGLIFSRYEETQCTMLMKSGAGAQDTGYLVSGSREWTGTGCRMHKLKTQALSDSHAIEFPKAFLFHHPNQHHHLGSKYSNTGTVGAFHTQMTTGSGCFLSQI